MNEKIRNVNSELRSACLNGNIEVVKHLLTSPDIKNHADISHGDDIALRYACQEGYLDIVHYLLTSSELKDHADIHAKHEGALKEACFNNHLHIVIYLLTSPDLKEHANVNEKNVIRKTFENPNKTVAEYLVFDYRIEKISELKLNSPLFEKIKYDVINMFEKRELVDKMNKDLNTNLSTRSNNKI